MGFSGDKNNSLGLKNKYAILSKCQKASALMMKYMDGSISIDEAEWLNKHISTCTECKEDFQTYDSMLNDFSEAQVIIAPEGFEQAVMKKIDALPERINKTAQQYMDSIICAVWGVFSIIFGAGFVLFLNRDYIMEAMKGNQAFAAYVQVITPVSKIVSEFTANLKIVFTGSLAYAGSVFSAYRYFIFGMVAALIILQYVLRMKKRNIDVAFAEEKADNKA